MSSLISLKLKPLLGPPSLDTKCAFEGAKVTLVLQLFKMASLYTVY